MDSTTGAYRVATQSSTYEIDLDRMILRRLPRTQNSEGSLLRRDDELIMLLAIEECTVGRRMSLLVDLNVLGVPFTTRYATEVVSIEPIGSPGTKATALSDTEILNPPTDNATHLHDQRSEETP